MRMGTIRFLAISLFILLSISQANGQYSQSNSPGAVAASRVVPLTIKVVLLGFSNTDLNSSYLTSGINSIPVKYQQVLQGPINTGVMYNFTYQYVYEEASSALVQSFARYVNSTGKEQDTVPGTPPPFFGNPALNKTSTKVSLVQNYFYDANKVENWLISNQTLFGAIPNPGYTLFISDLNRTIIPSLSFQQYQVAITKCSCNSTMAVQAHYYNRTVTDPDLGLSLPRHYMTSWGGTGRIYYTDLSAGTSYWTNELPMQVAAGARGVNLSTPYGRIWAAEFVNDYISGAVYNLFAADQLYPVTYAQRYNFQLFVFDNRTDAEKAKGPKISTTLNTTMVQNQLASLLPFATVTVSAKFSDITAYPQLAAVVANATTKVKDPALSIPIVDARLVWNWLSVYGKGHMTQFINATHTTSQYDIPGFLFAFQGNYTFAFTFKENIELSEPPGSIGGVALGDMILVNQSNSTLTYGYNVFPKQPGKGFGFTRATIHELGHMIGLNHPFIYDQTEDFTNSVMAYYPDSNTYSQFDKDTVLRGINDELLIIAQDALAATGNSLINSGTIATANREMALANQHYSTMDYAGAVQHSLAAALSALQAEQSGSLFSSGLVFGLIGLAVGVAAGLLLGFLFFRKRKVTTAVGYNRCPTCQQPVRWDPVQMKWYCDRCQKPV
ncbi:MAG: hypothetical protein AUI50_07920 [Crenarchaeota archaeon 13_1_40CM_2_52_14]|nr:MAG: hypothetical protein AUI50_07920 [Crenarchaeota archaeon 13_1_40CM_2_52_14]